MFTPQEDPLGLDLQARARAQRFQDSLRGLHSAMGPLADPQWEGYWQALQDSGVSGLTAGPSPTGSHQLTGVHTNGQVGSETYTPKGASVHFRTPPVAPTPMPEDEASWEARTRRKTPYLPAQSQEGWEYTNKKKIYGAGDATPGTPLERQDAWEQRMKTAIYGLQKAASNG